MATTEIHGNCDEKFEPVRETFAAAFDSGLEVGAAVAVTIDNELVVDLWAGHADHAGTRPWQRDTIANFYSTTKGVVALLAHRLVEEGRIDLDAPVTRYWPEFGQVGKQTMPVRHLLNHKAGLPAVSMHLALDAIYDWSVMTEALAAQEPWWQPGAAHGYHAVTYGWLIGEVMRRVTGKSVGSYLRDEIAEPLGLDLWIGLPESEDGRCAELAAPQLTIVEGQPNLLELIMRDPESVTAKAFTNPPTLMMPGTVNSRPWRGAEIPGANGHGSARSLAQLYGAVASGGDLRGVHVLGPQQAARAATEEARGMDLVLQMNTRIGLGFMLSQPHASFSPREGAFGHPGAGGSVAFADPSVKMGFGYVMNRMGPHILIDPRAQALINAAHSCVW
ncbi:MAG TPA: serine hydrolase domain-containing protein [Candidatus Limnocylindrales bacterium]|nr:serine hydrolase domain-containing protein [Candidatus Limnocylindrales bacterium]